MDYRYEIGWRVYIQKPLVIGQIRQMSNCLKGIEIRQNMDVISLIAALGDRLPHALAIVLIPEGEPLKSKNLEVVREIIETEMSPEIAIKVIEDFFTCNPISLLLEKLNQAVGKTLKDNTMMTGLKTSSASLQKETSQGGTILSGDIPSENASLT